MNSNELFNIADSILRKIFVKDSVRLAVLLHTIIKAHQHASGARKEKKSNRFIGKINIFKASDSIESVCYRHVCFHPLLNFHFSIDHRKKSFSRESH